MAAKSRVSRAHSILSSAWLLCFRPRFAVSHASTFVASDYCAVQSSSICDLNLSEFKEKRRRGRLLGRGRIRTFTHADSRTSLLPNGGRDELERRIPGR